MIISKGMIMLFGEVRKLIQLPSLCIDILLKICSNTQEGKLLCFSEPVHKRNSIVRGFIQKATIRVLSIAPVPHLERYSGILNSQTINYSKLCNEHSFMPTFLLPLIALFGSCVTSACLTISGQGRSRYLEKLCINHNKGL